MLVPDRSYRQSGYKVQNISPRALLGKKGQDKDKFYMSIFQTMHLQFRGHLKVG